MVKDKKRPTTVSRVYTLEGDMEELDAKVDVTLRKVTHKIADYSQAVALILKSVQAVYNDVELLHEIIANNTRVMDKNTRIFAKKLGIDVGEWET